MSLRVLPFFLALLGLVAEIAILQGPRRGTRNSRMLLR